MSWLKKLTHKQYLFSLNGAEPSFNSLNSANSQNLRNHGSMNWVQYKDLLCYLCLCGLVVSFLSLTHEVLGSIFLSLNSANLEKTPIISAQRISDLCPKPLNRLLQQVSLHYQYYHICLGHLNYNTNQNQQNPLFILKPTSSDLHNSNVGKCYLFHHTEADTTSNAIPLLDLCVQDYFLWSTRLILSALLAVKSMTIQFFPRSSAELANQIYSHGLYDSKIKG